MPKGLDISHGPILYLDDITVSFDGFKALNKLTLTVDAGELRCVIGPNGAGKTTMMDVITGKTQPDCGHGLLRPDHRPHAADRAQIAHAGIGRKFQKPTVFENHTVFENLELAMKTDKRVCASVRAGSAPSSWTVSRRRWIMIQLIAEADKLAGLLSHGQKQWLEIGMLLMQEPKLLLLDEPVAGMTDEETERTGELFKTLAGKHSVIVVEHDMEFIGRIAEPRHGVARRQRAGGGDDGPIKNDERVIEVYLGR